MTADISSAMFCRRCHTWTKELVTDAEFRAFERWICPGCMEGGRL